MKKPKDFHSQPWHIQEYIQHLEKQLEKWQSKHNDQKLECEHIARMNVEKDKQIERLASELISWNEMVLSGQPFGMDTEGCRKRIDELKQLEK